MNLKPLNQFLVYEHFKMEGVHMLRDLLREGDYLVKIDLKDAYLTVPIWKGHQKYLRFLWKDALSSLWTGHSSQGLHKIDETCFNPESPRKSGICNQLQEIPTCTKSTDRISRFPHRFCSYVTPTTRRKVTKNKEAVSAIAKSRAGINSRIIKIPGPINLVHPGSISSPSSVGLEIVCWRDHLQSWNGRVLFHKPVDLVIETDASRKGWGHFARG